jgi:uncharacterized protein YgbK (DUF1537 family)
MQESDHIPVDRAALLGSLPLEPDVSALWAEIRAAVADPRRRVVVLDDDPTGAQTMHDIDVLTTWEVDDLVHALAGPDPLFYVLTNSRALPRQEAVDLAAALAANLAQAIDRTGVHAAVISRSDSTLRGHYPWELEPLSRLYGSAGPDGVLIVPAFPEGGRITVHGVHYVAEGERFLPAAQSAFARDPSFGYSHSWLPAWVEEKTAGHWPADAVLQVPLALLRQGDPDPICAILLGARNGQPVVVDVASYSDLIVLVGALLRAERQGRRFLCRTAASFVRVRGGLEEQPLLQRSDLLPPGPAAGLVVVGSYVPRTTEQLAKALALPELPAHELLVPTLLGDERALALQQARDWLLQALASGRSALIYTSRELISTHAGHDHLAIGKAVSSALTSLVAQLTVQPAWLIAKGGITSSDVATEGLGVRRARVLGQLATGVAVWQLGDESRFPGLPYIVFPGNVGTADTLAALITLLDGQITADHA